MPKRPTPEVESLRREIRRLRDSVETMKRSSRPDDPQQMLGFTEVCALLGKSQSTVRNWINSPSLSMRYRVRGKGGLFFKVGGGWRSTRRRLAEWQAHFVAEEERTFGTNPAAE